MRGAAAAEKTPTRSRVIFCTCGGLYGALVWRRLRACERLEVCAIVRSTRVLDPGFGFLRGAIAQIRRSGVRYALFLWCITTLADWLGHLHGAHAVPSHTTQNGPLVLTTRNINDPEALRFIEASAPDLIVSAFFNQRVLPAALALPRLGCLNIHPSLLPEAKGVDPVFQCLLHGAPPLGVTVHFMSPEFDTGQIVAQRALVAPVETGVFAVTALLFAEGADLLANALESVAEGTRGVSQRGGGTYQSWPTRQELRIFRVRGGALLHLADLVRLARGWLPRVRLKSPSPRKS